MTSRQQQQQQQQPQPETEAEASRERSYFEQQRAALVGDVALSFEHVLANINKLNRSLDAVVAVGNEFSSVEALWSQFENVMAKDDDAAAKAEPAQDGGSGHGRDHEP